MHRELRLGIAKRGFTFAVPGRLAQVGAPEEVGKGHSAVATIGFDKHLAGFECQSVGFAAFEGRGRGMMITASREKCRSLPVALPEFESEHVAIKCKRPIKVGGLQMNMADSDIRVNWLWLWFHSSVGHPCFYAASSLVAATVRAPPVS